MAPFGIIIFLVSLAISLLYYNIILVPKPHIVVFSAIDKFGVNEIYPTKYGGREWFINMENPKKDPLFLITNDVPIIKHISDGSWFVNNSQTRLNVITPHGYTQWKNIEMTGYVKAIPIINQTTTSLFNNNVNNNNIEESKNIVDISGKQEVDHIIAKPPAKVLLTMVEYILMGQ